ncbi:unnamed protein product [Ambrosiozyma monospora]|uniref:Unnamed protein product n=1 Tax=Ambrosiozyma monospora TaxID=43982 RepID=A0ACB5TCI8_AMBMO|nr:unnamed protein product [Ambrosiozyma monospora]
MHVQLDSLEVHYIFCKCDESDLLLISLELEFFNLGIKFIWWKIMQNAIQFNIIETAGENIKIIIGGNNVKPGSHITEQSLVTNSRYF